MTSAAGDVKQPTAESSIFWISARGVPIHELRSVMEKVPQFADKPQVGTMQSPFFISYKADDVHGFLDLLHGRFVTDYQRACGVAHDLGYEVPERKVRSPKEYKNHNKDEEDDAAPGEEDERPFSPASSSFKRGGSQARTPRRDREDIDVESLLEDVKRCIRSSIPTKSGSGVYTFSLDLPSSVKNLSIPQKRLINRKFDSRGVKFLDAQKKPINFNSHFLDVITETFTLHPHH